MEEPASECTLDAREGVAAVDEVMCAGVGVEGFAGGMDGQGIDVVGGMPVPRVSRPGCPAEAGSRLNLVAETESVQGGPERRWKYAHRTPPSSPREKRREELQ